MITGRDRGDVAFWSKNSLKLHIYGVTSAGLKNLLLKSEATSPVVATRLVYLAAIQTTYT